MQGKKPPKNYTDDYRTDETSPLTVEMQSIGIVRSPYKERFAAPRQPQLAEPVSATIELHKGMNLHQALDGLEEFSHIWVIYWMHLNKGWNPTVMPPRGPKVRRGILATRAPHRPNCIGLSTAKLLKIDGLTLHIEGTDMLDGTPVLDIKPYLPYADSIAEANHGWLEGSDLIPS